MNTADEAGWQFESAWCTARALSSIGRASFLHSEGSRFESDRVHVFNRAQYDLQRYRRRRAWAISYLGGRCGECGSVIDLEFDHLDPSAKSFEISSALLHGNAKLLPELDKCTLRCKQHHRERTADQRSVGHGEGRSGKRNCRCAKCKARKAEYMRERRKSQKNADAR